jgi:heme-degrading monooxygenase HmoA
VLINPFEVPAEGDRDFVRRWEQAKEFLAERDGYVDTTLHRSVTPDAEFRFVNIAAWPSTAAFQAAIDDPAFRTATAGTAGRAHPSLYEVVHR